MEFLLVMFQDWVQPIQIRVVEGFLEAALLWPHGQVNVTSTFKDKRSKSGISFVYSGQNSHLLREAGNFVEGNILWEFLMWEMLSP